MGSLIPLTKGFTFIEVVVVVAIIAALLVAAGGITRTYQTEQAMQTASAVYAQALHRAQLLAQSGVGDSMWGVLIATSSVTLYKGARYAARTSGFDEQYAFGSALTITGLSEVDFAKLTGSTVTTGTTTISAPGIAGTKSVGVNADGSVTF